MIEPRDDLVEDERLDRLVDDELSDRQRQQLLEGLEHQSDGWRRCAMAFLESQAWQSSLKGLPTGVIDQPHATTDESAMTRPIDAEEESARSWSSPTTAPWLTLAASILVAFSLGWISQSVFYPHGVNRDVTIAENEPRQPTSPDSRGPSGELLVQTPEARTMHSPNGAAEPMRADDPSIWAGIPVMHPELIESFRRQGRDVLRQRWIAPSVQNGRRVMVPVEEYFVTPVRDLTY